MSYTNPSTAGTGGTVLAALWNTDVKDNLSYLYSQGTARNAESSSLAGSITVAQNYVDDIITYQPIGTISGTSAYTVGTADANYLYQVNPGSGTTTIALGNSHPTGTKVDFVQTGLGTVLFSEWTPRESNRNWFSVASSSDGTKLVAVVAAGQIYTSTDSGVNWTPRDSVRNWSSVASSSDGTKLVAVVNGGQIYTSTDSGVNWTPRDSPGPSNKSWQSVASSSDGTKLVAVDFGGPIYTSTDSGVSWTPRESVRDWNSVASSSDGTKLVAVLQIGQIYTSTDSGVNWTARESVRDWRSVASSSDGTKLVAVATSGQIYTSTDSGVNWTPRESNRNWYRVASSSDGTKLVATVYGGQIYTSTDLILTTPSYKLRTQYSAASVLKINNTNWLLFGDLA